MLYLTISRDKEIKISRNLEKANVTPKRWAFVVMAMKENKRDQIVQV